MDDFVMKKKIRRQKWLICGSIFFTVIAILFVSIVMCNHLYSIRKIERLKKVEDYTKFTLTMRLSNRCDEEEITLFVHEDVVYKTKCFKEIYVFYGSTFLSLEEAYEKNYFKLKDIFYHMIRTKGEEYDTYEYFRGLTSEENYRIIAYKNEEGKVKEVLFEKLI